MKTALPSCNLLVIESFKKDQYEVDKFYHCRPGPGALRARASPGPTQRPVFIFFLFSIISKNII